MFLPVTDARTVLRLNFSRRFAHLFAHPVYGARLTRLRRMIERANEDNLDQIAGSLTFLTLLAIVPFITMVLALFAAFQVFGDFQIAIGEYLKDSLLPEATGAMVMSHIADFVTNATQMTVAGLAMLMLTVFMLMQTIEKCFNRIWRVTRGRSVTRRVVLYAAALVLGPLLIGGSLAATTFLVSASMGVLPETVWLDKLILTAVPIVMAALAFTLLFRCVPNCAVRLHHALVGGVLAAVGFELMKTLFGLYIAAFPSYQMVYGAFAAIPIFLIWIYLSWIVTLIGAIVVAALPPLGPASLPELLPAAHSLHSPQPAPVPHNPRPQRGRSKRRAAAP